MIRPIILSATLILSLGAGSIDLVEAPPYTERIMPKPRGAILSYHEAIKHTTDTIVNIATTQKSLAQQLPQSFNPLFEQFFGPQFHSKKAPKRKSLGSGVIISKDGYLITNNHVIDKADEIIVTIPGSAKEYKAKLIGTDPKSDIAVIKIEAKALHPISIGTSSDLKVGDVVFAIGNPFGVGLSVTQGIISAQHKTGVGINEYENYIQTDASINPGNSGGALVDSRGALIGINTAIMTRSGGNDGIGFAIEVDMIKNIVKKLIEHGSIERGYLGVSIGNLTKGLLNLYTNKEGAMLLEVHSDTPAAKAGLKRGDLIVKIDDESVSNAADLKNKIGLLAPHTKVAITYERDKKIFESTVKLGNLSESGGSALLDGLELSELNEQLRYQHRIPHDVNGIVIIKVKPESEAEEQGLQKGDVIIQIEKYPLGTMDGFKKALNNYKDVYKRVYISRKGHVFVVALK